MFTSYRFIGLCAAFCSLFTTLPQLVKAQCRGKIIYEGDLNEPPATANSCANPEDLLFQEWQIKNVSSDNIVNNYYTIRLIEKNGVDRTSDFLQYYTPSDASGNTIPNHPSPNLAPWQTGVHLPVYFKFAPPEGGLYEIFYVRHDGVQCGTLRGGLSTKVYICQGAVNPPELKLKSPNCISFVPVVGTDFFGDVPIQFSATLVNPTSRTFSVPLAEARIRPRNAQSVGTIIATIANKQLAPNATLTLKATQLPLPVSDLGVAASKFDTLCK